MSQVLWLWCLEKECLLVRLHSLKEDMGGNVSAVGKAPPLSTLVIVYLFSWAAKFRVAQRAEHIDEAGTNRRDSQCVLEGHWITLLEGLAERGWMGSYSFLRKIYPGTGRDVGFSLTQYPSTQGTPGAVLSWVVQIRCSPGLWGTHSLDSLPLQWPWVEKDEGKSV